MHLRLYQQLSPESAAADEPPVVRQTEKESHSSAATWNDTATAYPRDATVHGLFEVQAERHSASVALIDADRPVTYAELNQRANRLARYLQQQGVTPGSIVAIYLPRGTEAVVATLAALKAGAAYLPVDTNDPSRRVLDMLADARAACVVSAGRLVRRLEGAGCPVVAIDARSQDIAAGADHNLPVLVPATSACYVMYTSGSTGQPKGVVVGHRAVVRLVCGTQYIAFGADRTFLLLAPMCFDASTFELWGALLHGARLVVAPDGTPDPAVLTSLIKQHEVCTLWLTAGLFNTLVDVCPQLFGRLEQLLIGGEALSPHHVRRVDRLLPASARIVNGYGPTEGTTFTCCYNIPRPVAVDSTAIPIGRPIANTRAYVLDEQLRPAAMGVSGELCIGGDGLAAGYLNAPQLTAEKFIAPGFADCPDVRLYRTGDRVRWRDDGNLEFLGRMDDQFKLRGHRVEPGEIEQALCQFRGISRCVVSIRQGEAADQSLVAHFVAEGPPPTSSDLRAHLRSLLPEYMIPATFVQVAELPLNANGKVDRRSISQLAADVQPASPHVGLRSSAEREMADLWVEVLGSTRVGRNDHFVFDLAGHSLLGLQLVDRVNRRYGVRLTLPDLLTSPTVAALTAKIAESAKQPAAAVRYLSVARPGIGRDPVVCVGLANPLALLLDELPSRVPIWWLTLEGMHAPPYRIRPIAEIAENYAHELEREAAGEITLVGSSFCGLIALEVARKLRAAGRQVRALLIEPPLPEFFQGEPALLAEDGESGDQASAHGAVHRLAPTSAAAWQAACSWCADWLVRSVRRQIVKPCLSLGVWLGFPLPVRYRTWWYYLPQVKRRVAAFKIEPKSGPIFLAGQPSYMASHLLSWKSRLEGPIETCYLHGATQHDDLATRPAADEWLALLRQWTATAAPAHGVRAA